MYYIGIDVGGTNLKAGLVDETYGIVATRKEKLAFTTMEAMGKTLAMESCDKIMLGVGKIVGFFEKVTHLNITKSGKRKKN